MGPSFFDWLAAVRHQPYGSRIPWLESHEASSLTAIPGSVLALHVPSTGASGPGHLLVDHLGDAAFITANGTCWELGPLLRAIERTYPAADGTLQVFFARPTSLHATFEARDAHQLSELLAALEPQGQAGAAKSGADVGLFGSKSKSGSDPAVAFPVGQTPPAGVPLEDYLVSVALSKTPNSGIPHEDVMSYADAAYANVLGVPEHDLILAWGPALIETPTDSRAHKGTVVVTRNTMLAYWQPGRTSMIHTFQGNHSAVAALERPGPYQLVLQWDVAEFANNQGKFMVGDAPVALSARFDRDGHANRRALTWLFTLDALVTGLGQADGAPPDGSGGLGSSGTKL